jgi:hypothetical protein
MIKICLFISLPLLIVFTYVAINFRKIKFAYNIIVGLINLFCISFLVIKLTTKSNINIPLAVLNIIFSIVFLFRLDKFKSDSLKKTAFYFAKLLTFFPLIFIPFGGLIFVIITQPIAYLLTFYLVQSNFEKINKLVYTNLIISWLFLILMFWIVFWN